MEIKKKILRMFRFITDSIADPFDMRDFLLFSGLFILSYGLWLLSPWIGYSVGGLLLMLIALFMK